MLTLLDEYRDFMILFFNSLQIPQKLIFTFLPYSQITSHAEFNK